MFVEYNVDNAWPLLGVPDLNAFNARMVRGCAPDRFQVRDLVVSIPLPKPERQGSIDEFHAAFQRPMARDRPAIPSTTDVLSIDYDRVHPAARLIEDVGAD